MNSKRFYSSKVFPGFSPFKLMCCEIIVRFLVVNYCCKALRLRCLQESWISSLHRYYYGNAKGVFFTFFYKVSTLYDFKTSFTTWKK